MPRIYYLHWNKEEAAEQVRMLRDLGYTVSYHWDTKTNAKIDPLPDVFVISLARLPSHGRAVAEWCRESKKRQAVPLVFVNKKKEKVDATRQKFPDAIFCGSPELPKVLAKLTPSKK